MPADFESVWRKIRLYAPGAPVMLVRTWVQDAYAEVMDRRSWAWSVHQGQIAWADARTDLAVTVTRGSTTVTSAGLFLPADATRQFRVGGFPIYTVQTVVDANTILLDQPYYGTATGAVSADILDAWTTMPAAFGQFVIVVDPVNQRFVPWWATQEELALVDPTRWSTDSTPRLLIALGTSRLPATLGQMQYTYWPIPTAAGAFQYWATNRPTDLADDTPFAGVLATRTDVLETGALAACAQWPGTATDRNPYFNLALATQLRQQFEGLITQLDLRDDDQRPDSWSVIPWQRWNGFAWAYDCSLLQATDATLGDYAGYGGWSAPW